MDRAGVSRARRGALVERGHAARDGDRGRCQGRDASGETPWYSLGTWASGDEQIERTSVPGQDDGRCRVQIDTLVADGGLRAFRLRVSPTAAAGVGPRVRLVTAVASSRAFARAHRAERAVSRRAGRARCATALAVPAPWSLSRVRRRRRVVVQRRVDGDAARVLAARPYPGRHGMGRGGARRSVRRPRRPLDVRRGLRRLRQLGVQHRLRSDVRSRGVRHPTGLAPRGRGVSRRGHPPRRVDCRRCGRARRLSRGGYCRASRRPRRHDRRR